MTALDDDRFYNPALLDDAKVPWLHLLETGGDGTIGQGDPPYLYISTLLTAHREMRSARENYNSQMILPLLAAFAILDQVGECYAFTDTLAGEPDEKAPIKRALHHFPLPWGTLSPDEMHALYIMRNGLMHDAAFSSTERRGQKRSMIFRHDLGMSDPVRLPTRAWNGKPDDVCRETITWVNPDLIIGIADGAIDRLGQALKLGDDRMKVRLPAQEIAARFLLWQRQRPRTFADYDVELMGEGRQSMRRTLRDELTAAEVERHMKRYHPE